nr:hypothetical protein CFP56_45035 [Quercus suber]
MDNGGWPNNKNKEKGMEKKLRIPLKKSTKLGRKTGVGGKPVIGIARQKENSPIPGDEVSEASSKSIEKEHENGKNSTTKDAYEVVENLEWAKETMGPIAMSYVQNKGWVSKELGPKSGHWKRLARQNKQTSPTEESDPSSKKREGFVRVDSSLTYAAPPSPMSV